MNNRGRKLVAALAFFCIYAAYAYIVLGQWLYRMAEYLFGTVRWDLSHFPDALRLVWRVDKVAAFMLAVMILLALNVIIRFLKLIFGRSPAEGSRLYRAPRKRAEGGDMAVRRGFADVRSADAGKSGTGRSKYSGRGRTDETLTGVKDTWSSWTIFCVTA